MIELANLVTAKFITAAILISTIPATPAIAQIAQKLVTVLSSPSHLQPRSTELTDCSVIINPDDPGSGGGRDSVFQD